MEINFSFTAAKFIYTASEISLRMYVYPCISHKFLICMTHTEYQINFNPMYIQILVYIHTYVLVNVELNRLRSLAIALTTIVHQKLYVDHTFLPLTPQLIVYLRLSIIPYNVPPSQPIIIICIYIFIYICKNVYIFNL